jgi:hypothetical protein
MADLGFHEHATLRHALERAPAVNNSLVSVLITESNAIATSLQNLESDQHYRQSTTSSLYQYH